MAVAKRTFGKELVVGVLVALAGTAGGLVAARSGSSTAQCQQAVDLLTDDGLNQSLEDAYKHLVLKAAARKAVACMKE